jgi:hypothetical protein
MMIRLRCAMLLLLACCVVVPSARTQSPPLSRLAIARDLIAATVQDSLPPHTDVAPNSAKKKVGLAALYSLLIPGMGELYADGFSSGKYFLMAEGGLWITYAIFEIHGNDLRDAARAYSVSGAGVNLSGNDDQYFVDVGNFLSMDEYNDKRLRDREPERLYSAAAGEYWRWDSDASRLAFREQRIASENSYNNRKFVGAAILINHVVSAINAARAAISYNNSLEQSLGSLELSSRVLGAPGQEHGVLITLSKRF